MDMASMKLKTDKSKDSTQKKESSKKFLSEEILFLQEEYIAENLNPTPLTSYINVKSIKSDLASSSATMPNTAGDATAKISKANSKPGQHFEKIQLKKFAQELKKLQEAQSNFFTKYDELKKIDPSLIKEKYKAVGVTLIDDFGLRINEDDMLPVPNLGQESVNEIMETLKLCMIRLSDEMSDHVRALESENENNSEILDMLREKLNHNASTNIETCMKQIDKMFKHRKSEKADRELQEANKTKDRFEKQYENVRMGQVEEKISIERYYKRCIREAVEKNGKELKQHIKELQQLLAAQADKLDEKDRLIQSKSQDIQNLQKDLLELSAKEETSVPSLL